VIRVYLLLALAVLLAGYLLLRWLQKTPAAEVSALIKKLGWAVALLLLAFLVLTGKLTWLFALLGVTLAAAARMAPLLLRYAPQLQRLWLWFRASKAQQQSAGRQQGAATISEAEALQILGLKPGAAEAEIIEAHRKLIARLHPDKGGSAYLAAQINLAKKVLLGR